jgi:tetratricopeptide (TPR) repeat protein
MARAACLSALACLALLWADAPEAGRRDRERTHPVRDLHYGEVLFHFYQDDHFGAITRLLAAREQDRLAHHADDASLLLGGMYVSYGQQAQAEAIFRELLNTDPRGEVRDRAWFYLAKLSWQRGQPERAARALGEVGRHLPPELAAQRELLSARLMMAQGDYAGAARELERWEGPGRWRDYASFNLGVALVRSGEIDRGTRYLDRIGAGKVAPDHVGIAGRVFTPWRLLFRDGAVDADLTYGEHEALADKANVALGFAYLQNDEPGKAARYLARVEADSPWAPQAMLGRGWAHAAEGDYEAALDPWSRLEGGDPFDPAVQEAHLAVPYALGKLEDYPRAVARYNAAIDPFGDEMERLDEVSLATFGDGFLADLLGGAQGDDLGWFWQLERLPDTAQTRYLYRLLADHGFQEAVKNYRDLRLLRENLGRWRDGVQAYRDMLATRRARFEERVSLMDASLSSGRLDSLDSGADALRARIARIAAEGDAAGLAGAEEIELLDMLDRVESRLAALPRDRGAHTGRLAELEEKYRVLKGVLLWRLEREFPTRLWERRKQLRTLDAALAESHERTDALVAAREGAAERLAAFAARVEAIAPRVDALIERIDALMGGHGEYIHALALATLEERRQRLRAYLTEAQYALASVYDSAAHGGGQ